MRRAIRDLCHPLPIGMAAVVALNDHLLKAAWPGWVTGKLSDVAGLAFFPVLLVALADVCASGALSRDEGLRRRAAWAATLLTGVAFSAVQMSPALAAWLATWWGVLTPDLTDLLTLPALGVALWWLLRPVASAPTPQHMPCAARRLRPVEGLALITCALISAATPSRPPPLYKTVRAYPIWRFDGGAFTFTEGCAKTTVWLAKSGKTGVGVMAHVRNGCEHALVWRLDSVQIEVRRGADVIAKVGQGTSQPDGLLVAGGGGEASAYVPLPFNNEAAWDVGARQGTLRLWQALYKEGVPGRPPATSHQRPITHSRPGPHRVVYTRYGMEQARRGRTTYRRYGQQPPPPQPPESDPEYTP